MTTVYASAAAEALDRFDHVLDLPSVRLTLEMWDRSPCSSCSSRGRSGASVVTERPGLPATRARSIRGRAFEVAGTALQRLDSVAAQFARTKQSALVTAFRGEPMPTEAALAEAESRDHEPADVLPARAAQPGVAP